MKRSEILELAKTELWDGKDPTWSKSLWRMVQEFLGYRHKEGSSEFICRAIERACEVNHKLFASPLEAVEGEQATRDYVMGKLEGYRTYTIWRQSKHLVYVFATREAEQAARLAWLNVLIAESKAEGELTVKDSEILKLAKAQLWQGPQVERLGTKYKGVCACIWEVDKLPHATQAAALRLGIEKSIRPHSSVISWLAEQLGVDADTISFQERQDYRHRWLDHMIAECEAKGR